MAFAAGHLDLIADAYGRRGPSQRLARGMLARLDALSVEEIFADGLHEFIQEFIAENKENWKQVRVFDSVA